jgi:hypothetical protein
LLMSVMSTRATDYNFLLESTDTSYLNQFYRFLHNGERWQMHINMVGRQLTYQMESTIQIRCQELT